jgi:hypothetical protein
VSGTGESATDEAQRAGRELERSSAVDMVARVGLVAYGVVHLVLAWLALELAVGHTSKKADTTGAMHELAAQPLGRPLLWAVTVGMFLLVVWRVVEALFGQRQHDGLGRLVRRVGSAATAVVYGAIGVSALRTAAGQRSSDNPKGLTAHVLQWPAGPALVVVAGLVVLGIGIGLFVVGVTARFARSMEPGSTHGAPGAAYRLLGRVGYLAKGCALGVVGGLVGYAGLTHDPSDSGGLDEALQRLLQQPFGPALTGAIGVGLGCFGLFCFAWSRHLDR